MTDRANNFNKTFLMNWWCNNSIFIIVFDVNQPGSDRQGQLTRKIKEEYWINNQQRYAGRYMALIEIDNTNMVANISYVNEDKRKQALQIARHYRPRIGRDWVSVCASIILGFPTDDYLSSIRFNLIFGENQIAEIINIINSAKQQRHPVNNNTDFNFPRFIVLPYLTKIKTGVLKNVEWSWHSPIF